MKEQGLQSSVRGSNFDHDVLTRVDRDGPAEIWTEGEHQDLVSPANIIIEL